MYGYDVHPIRKTAHEFAASISGRLDMLCMEPAAREDIRVRFSLVAEFSNPGSSDGDIRGRWPPIARIVFGRVPR
jgi:hypothetical protein